MDQCNINRLINLKGFPDELGGSFTCADNGPEQVMGYFNCGNNKLNTLKGCPKIVGGDFFCYYNELTTLSNYPDELYGYFYCNDNPVYNLIKIFNDDYKLFLYSLDYGYLRGKNSIVELRFRESCLEIDIESSEEIMEYNFI